MSVRWSRGRASHLLGGHVAHRSHHRPRRGLAGARRRARLLVGLLDALGQAEIQELEVAIARHEDVLGLQVPVDDAPGLGNGFPLITEGKQG